jgi:hypothetical protein
MLRLLLIGILLAATSGCGTERIYLQQEAVLPIARADLDRFIFVVEVEEIDPDNSVAFVSFQASCLDSKKLNPEYFTLHPGETYTNQRGEAFTLISVDQAQQTAFVRGNQSVEVKKSLFPRQRHPHERPAPNHHYEAPNVKGGRG